MKNWSLISSFLFLFLINSITSELCTCRSCREQNLVPSTICIAVKMKCQDFLLGGMYYDFVQCRKCCVSLRDDKDLFASHCQMDKEQPLITDNSKTSKTKPTKSKDKSQKGKTEDKKIFRRPLPYMGYVTDTEPCALTPV
eukprot:c27388_g1_i1.p1 GENE.c27388_g1_i1~~c27388_g1_i1.p1  ORF type:complete len:154 (-),score=48.13 c27388_g1_i1:28-447(-)